MKWLYLSFIGVVLNVSSVQAAPCCAGSAVFPSLIAGDDLAQLSLFSSYSSVIGDAYRDGLPEFRASDNTEASQVFRLDGAALLLDRFQAGISMPLMINVRSIGDDTSSLMGLGDVRFNLGYEVLTEREYSVWKPKGHLFLQTVLPTGKSLNDIGSTTSAAVGRGYYTLGLGMLLLKQWRVWDAFLIPEIHYSFSRTFPKDLVLKPGWAASATFGLGVSPFAGPLRVGLSLQPMYDQPLTRTQKDVTTVESYKLSWNTALQLTYMIQSNWSAIGTYTDQTLIGPAVSSTLSRSIALALQHRWER